MRCNVPCKQCGGSKPAISTLRGRTVARVAQREEVQQAALDKSRGAGKRIAQISGDTIENFGGGADGRWANLASSQSSSQEQLVERVKGLFLPEGYPHSVTPDYLEFQLWSVPTHITGWLASSLVTSSLLQAVGVGASPATAAAAGAAIKWITKDGIGAFGRFLVGGPLARYFDEDPRYWRLVAQAINVFGAALEVVTLGTPSAFIFLASTGNLARALGRGISRPTFRVIQNHFASRGGRNVGDIAAKEEIWEVSAQLTGLAFSVGALTALSKMPDPSGSNIVTVWVAVEAVHISLRYKALSVLRLPWLSQKRATMLAECFVAGEPVPSVHALCASEPLLLPKWLLQPDMAFNASVMQLDAAAGALHLASRLSPPAASSTAALDRTSSSASAGASVGDGSSDGAAASSSERSAGNRNSDGDGAGHGTVGDDTPATGEARRDSRGTSAASLASENGAEDGSRGVSLDGTRGADASRGSNSSGAVRGQSGDGAGGTAGLTAAAPTTDDLSALLQLYGPDAYVLVPQAVPSLSPLRAAVRWASRKENFSSHQLLVGVSEHAAPEDYLQAVLQATWLHGEMSRRHAAGAAAGHADSLSHDDLAAIELLPRSLEYARRERAAFLRALEVGGWDTDDVRIRCSQTYLLRYDV